MASIVLNEETQLNLDMEAMTVNTEGHCDEWNVRHKQLLENDHYLDKQMQAIKKDVGNKVASIAGKGLSTNDYTTAEKTKLAGIATGANKTTVVNNLTSESPTEALSAAQGKALDAKIGAKVVITDDDTTPPDDHSVLWVHG